MFYNWYSQLVTKFYILQDRTLHILIRKKIFFHHLDIISFKPKVLKNLKNFKLSSLEE